MNLEELNKQMMAFQNDYNTKSNNIKSNSNILNTTQIKRPHKSDEHRDFINSKLSNLNMFNPETNEQPPNMMPIANNIINDKRIDYREKMNNKLDNFIFDNPNAIPLDNPIYKPQTNTNIRDSRMIIQGSNKDFYRQEANNRMAHYSPLSKASNAPITMANMSVNDFYSNQYIDTDKDILNSRLTECGKNIQQTTQHKN